MSDIDLLVGGEAPAI